jgi:hypothetical protein
MSAGVHNPFYTEHLLPRLVMIPNILTRPGNETNLFSRINFRNSKHDAGRNRSRNGKTRESLKCLTYTIRD